MYRNLVENLMLVEFDYGKAASYAASVGLAGSSALVGLMPPLPKATQNIPIKQPVAITRPVEEPNLIAKQIEEPVKVVKSSVIDLDAIWFIESTNGTDLWNEDTRARGHYQFLETTWDAIVKRMGKKWDWWNDSMDKHKSEQVADYYYNKRIPQMLKYYGITDTIEARIGAYDWGIGNVNKLWKRHKDKWVNFIPKETRDYIDKYYEQSL